MSKRINVLGIGFDDITIDQAVSQACDMIHNDSNSYIVTPNPEIVWVCRNTEALTTAVNDAALVLPDGIGIVIAARILGTPLNGGRVPGIDFSAALLRKVAEINGSVFLLGAKPGIAEEAGNKLAAQFPGLRISGTADGYFSDVKPIIDQINTAAPDLLFVCLGAPKQELWMSNYVKQLNVRLSVGLGGVLDVFAGRARRAPVFIQKLGFEWLYRLIRDPRRIKRSMRLPLFVLAVIWRRISGNGDTCSI